MNKHYIYHVALKKKKGRQVFLRQREHFYQVGNVGKFAVCIKTHRKSHWKKGTIYKLPDRVWFPTKFFRGLRQLEKFLVLSKKYTFSRAPSFKGRVKNNEMGFYSGERGSVK